ncbi:hypothetical protein K440DRAFT_537165 [Wilcoxina mikolae CBS 423.85]|nr:hypothetical protein K440DRAFT_537165 [Wilcoxina mikolae CBS 423.85]
MADIFHESLPDGFRVIPVILGSDKIMLSILSGNKSALPVYLSIGNLFKSNGLILIGLLPRCPNGPNIYTIKIAYQESMTTMLRTLEEPVKSEIKVHCADGRTRHAYLRIASFLADYPEQCNITGIKYGWCPHGEIDPDNIPGFNRRSR